MDVQKAFWVVCVTLFIVIGFNLAIYFGYARRAGANQVDIARQLVERARNPWKNEDDDLEELSQRVRNLSTTGDDPKNSTQPNSSGTADE